MKVVKHNVSVRDRVTKKSKVVAVIDVPVYDTLDELLKHEVEGDIVANFNRQNVQDMANRERVKYTQGPSLKAKRAEGLEWLVDNDVPRLVAWKAAGKDIDTLCEVVWNEVHANDVVGDEGDGSDE